MIDKLEKSLIKLRQRKPLVICLTNFVTMDFVANSLLSIGAAPIMSASEDEIEELINIASALYINIGTLRDSSISLTKKAIEIAKKHNKPIILDPVSSGATKIRTETAKYIAPFANFIRGNSSEIISLASNSHTTYGVEASNTTDEAASIAKDLSLELNGVVIVSGPVDFITNGQQSLEVPFGSPLMQMVTGMGCSLTAVIAAFAAIEEDAFAAAIIAAHYFALCGEIVAKQQQSPAAFKVAFLDQLYKPDFALMTKLYKAKIND